MNWKIRLEKFKYDLKWWLIKHENKIVIAFGVLYLLTATYIVKKSM